MALEKPKYVLACQRQAFVSKDFLEEIISPYFLILINKWIVLEEDEEHSSFSYMCFFVI